MLVELSKGLKAKKLKVGDKVKAEVSQDVVSRGKVIIPVETKLVGHVTEVNPRDSAHPESRLGIVFDRILLKHFHDIDFEAVVQAVSQPVIRRPLVDEPSQMLPPSMVGGGTRNSGPTGRGNTGQTPINSDQLSWRVFDDNRGSYNCQGVADQLMPKVPVLCWKLLPAVRR